MIDNIFQKYMRSKKNRKNISESPFAARLWDFGPPSVLKIKFDTSLNNISCFMGKGTSKKIHRKKTSSFSRQKMSLSKGKSSQQKVRLVETKKIEKKERNASPDILLEFTNSIVQKIEEKGINCAWQDNEEPNENNDVPDDAIWSAFDAQSSHDKSFASTNDFHHYHSVTSGPKFSSYCATWSPMIQSQVEKEYIPPANSFQINIDLIQKDWRTTLMIRNIPNKYTISDLAAEIDMHLPNTYDFLYLPCDFKNQCNVGYGFINFVTTKDLEAFYEKFDVYHWKKYKSQKICALTYARLQGLNQLIEHFENSKVLNQKDKKYRPIIKIDKIHKMVLEQQGR